MFYYGELMIDRGLTSLLYRKNSALYLIYLFNPERNLEAIFSSSALSAAKAP